MTESRDDGSGRCTVHYGYVLAAAWLRLIPRQARDDVFAGLLGFALSPSQLVTRTPPCWILRREDWLLSCLD
jgi:hypothetical protein